MFKKKGSIDPIFFLAWAKAVRLALGMAVPSGVIFGASALARVAGLVAGGGAGHGKFLRSGRCHAYPLTRSRVAGLETERFAGAGHV